MPIPNMDKLDKAIQEAYDHWNEDWATWINLPYGAHSTELYSKFLQTRDFWHGLRAAKMLIESTIPG